MNMNVLNDFPYTKRYYLLHPFKFFKELYNNVRAAYRRIKYGWAYIDCWNMDSWLLEILPAMLRHLAEHSCGWPDSKFNSFEEWQDFLYKLANEIEVLQEDKWYEQNEFSDDFHNMMEEHQFWGEENKNITTTYHFDKELKDNYFNRSKELGELRDEKIKEVFKTLGENLNYLWD